MQRPCGFLVCRFLILCAFAASAAVVAVAFAEAASFHDMPAGAARIAHAANGRAHAVLYEDGTMKGLDDQGLDDRRVLDCLIDPAPDREGADAAVLDDIGRRAAAACRDGPCGVAPRDAMTAVAEPSVLVLLGAGVALLGWRRRQAWSFTPLAPRCPG